MILEALLILHLVIANGGFVRSQSLVTTCRSLFRLYVDCEKELVQVGLCLTALRNGSDVPVLGFCPYVTSNTSAFEKTIYSANFYHIQFEMSTLTEQTCSSLNRKGVLCSECFEGYGPAVFAFGNECVKCSGSVYGNWALYLFVVLFPITLFYIIVIVFNVHAVAPPLTAFVFYCQIVSILDRMQMPTPSKFRSKYHSPTLLLAARTLFGIWNLDFGRHILPPFCVGENLNSYHALLLDYIAAFYPMVLIIATYVLIRLHGNNCKLVVALWTPFHRFFTKARRSWDPQASIVNTFASFLFLTFAKILFISNYSTNSINLYTFNLTEYKGRLYYNPSITVGSREHLPMIVITYTLTSIFVYLPTVLLCCYPLRPFKHIVFFCCSRKRLVVDMFMDKFQGYYKDGTNGTRDWRFLSGLYPLLISLTLPNLNQLYRHSYNHVLMFFIVSTVFAVVRPYKKLVHNVLEILLLNLIVFIVTYSTGLSTIQRANYFSDDIQYSLSIAAAFLFPHVILFLVVAYKIFCLIKQPLISSHNNGCVSKYISLREKCKKIFCVDGCDKQDASVRPLVQYGSV